MTFYCPLCRVPRAFRYRSNLTGKNMVQLSVLSLILFLLFFPVMGAKAFVWFFIVWISFEFFRKLLFRKEIPCPHCGFDATWYKKDVRVAKRLVQEFWDKREGEEDLGEEKPVTHLLNNQHKDENLLHDQT